MYSLHLYLKLIVSISATLFIVASNSVFAFATYNDCAKNCHRGFEKNNYVSMQDGTPWRQSLMDGHEIFVDSCDACHGSGKKGKVYLNSSKDSSLSKSCVGCHGRDEDVNGNCTGDNDGINAECGSGAGLRRSHESNVRSGICDSCHRGDPVPVREHIAPSYYGMSRVAMQDACDSDGTESGIGFVGLDNDGDGHRDGNDADCQPLTSVERGALAYDDWIQLESGGTGLLPTGSVDKDYVRCKACHGWDHLGADGGYVRRSREQGQPNAGSDDGDQTSRNISLAGREGASISAEMIWHMTSGRSFSDGASAWLELDAIHSAANKAAHVNAQTLGNQHPDYSTGGVNGLSQEQVDDLVTFLGSEDADPSAYFATVNTSQIPVLYTITATADATTGEAFYIDRCQACHGDPATDFVGDNLGKPAGGILNYLAGDGKFSKFSHKSRWGIPGSVMSRRTLGSPTSSDIANLMLWLQESTGTGFAITAGISGHWWGGQTRSGEGFMLDVSLGVGDELLLIASFYSYDSMGNQVWLVGVGPVIGDTAVVDMTMPEGALWGEDFNPADLPDPRTPWGTATFSFISCGAGQVSLVPNTDMLHNGFTDLQYEINRDLLIPGIVCPTPTVGVP